MKTFYILCFLCCFSNIYSQSKLKKADQLFNTMAYVDAAKMYEEFLQKEDKPSTQTLKNVADAYYFTDDYRNALKWYKKLYSVQGNNLSDIHYLRYIQSLKGVTDYDIAEQVTKEYLDKKGDQNEVLRYMSHKKYRDSLANTEPIYTLKNLDINSPEADFGVAFFGDKVVFASSRNNKSINNKLYSWNKQPYLDLYIAERNFTDGSLFNEALFLKESNSKYHDATVTFSADLSTIYFTTNILNKKKLILDDSRTNNFQIIKGTLEGDKLIKAESMFFNSTEYSVGHPTLSEDGKWLFFVSDMPGGYGGTDLYVVQIAEDGTMGSPQNLGPKINTIGNEMFPFYKNEVLYFSSDGHYGYGNLDVYESKHNGALKFDYPKNLGTPINSNKDDFGYVIDKTEAYGYISSNRALGKGSDDIYYFTKSKPECFHWVSGFVRNSNVKTPIDKATIEVFDLFNDLIINTKTDENGSYQLKLPCNKAFVIKASKESYSSDERNLEPADKDGKETKDFNFELDFFDDLIVKEEGLEKIKINPIFFEYDKANIMKVSELELDKVISLMQKFPLVNIKIESHTDARGSDAYNMKLSDARAKATRDYILSKGIDSSRIESAIGYGESRLKNHCGNGVKCSEEEHFVNRRSDFIIIKK